MIRQPIQTQDRQQIGSRLHLRWEEFCAEQDHPPVPAFITTETVNLPGPQNEEGSGRTIDRLEVHDLGHRTLGHADQRVEGIMVQRQDLLGGHAAAQVRKMKYLNIQIAPARTVIELIQLRSALCHSRCANSGRTCAPADRRHCGAI